MKISLSSVTQTIYLKDTKYNNIIMDFLMENKRKLKSLLYYSMLTAAVCITIFG